MHAFEYITNTTVKLHNYIKTSKPQTPLDPPFKKNATVFHLKCEYGAVMTEY